MDSGIPPASKHDVKLMVGIFGSEIELSILLVDSQTKVLYKQDAKTPLVPCAAAYAR